MNNLFISSDHGGFTKKQVIIGWLEEEGWKVTDLGPFFLDPQDDYPLYAATVARRISADPTAKGILLCRSGQGVTIVANKFPRVRAALAWNEASARASREDDDANVLCLPADHVTAHQLREIIRTWLFTSFAPDKRYAHRLEEIRRIEDETMVEGG